MSQRAEFLRDKIRAGQGKSESIGYVCAALKSLRNELELQRKTATAVANILNFPDCGYGELAILCDRYGCNKGSLSKSGRHHPYYPMPPHTYTEIYEALFAGVRFSAQNIFECGVGTDDVSKHGNLSKNYTPGASLRVWRDYFFNAVIWGGDIDKNVLFTEERIRTGYLDQTSPESIAGFFSSAGVKAFDVMLDDGLHTFDAARCLFDHASQYLAPGGIYVIEDLVPQFMGRFQLHMQGRQDFIVKYFVMETPDNWENNLIVIKRKP
jgi:SAM-dependent methyltransferase